MSVLIGYASLACVVAGLVAAGVVVAVSRDGRAALRAALDLWVAAGLLGLARPVQWDQIAAAAAILVVRQVLVAALGEGSRR